MNKENWQPSPTDIEWTRRNVIEISKCPRTLWGVPMNGAVYLIDREEKKVTLLSGPEMGPRGNLFEQLRVIMAKFNYTVQRKPLGYEFSEAMQAAFKDALTGKTSVEVTKEVTDDIYGYGKSRHQGPRQ